MTDIEKLVEECGEETCQIIGTLAGGCFSPEDVCDDTRCFCKTIGKSVAEELIRRTLEWAAGSDEKLTNGDLLLVAGEMTAGELRSVRAILKWRSAKLRSLAILLAKDGME